MQLNYQTVRAETEYRRHKLSRDFPKRGRSSKNNKATDGHVSGSKRRLRTAWGV